MEMNISLNMNIYLIEHLPNELLVNKSKLYFYIKSNKDVQNIRMKVLEGNAISQNLNILNNQIFIVPLNLCSPNSIVANVLYCNICNIIEWLIGN